MPRRRWIDPSFWDDLDIGKLKPIERLFFIGCISNADDEGRLIGTPAYLRATIFKYDDMSMEEVTEIRNNVASANGNLMLYEVDGDDYLAFHRWGEYQKPNYPKESKLPAPPEVQEDRCRSDVEESSQGTKPDVIGRVGLGRVGLDRVGQDRCADVVSTCGADCSSLWKEILDELGRIHDRVAIQNYFAGSELAEVEPERVVVRLLPRNVSFVKLRLIGKLAEAIGVVAPDLAERKLILEAVGEG